VKARQREFCSSRSMAPHRCSIILVISSGAAKSGSGGGSASHPPSMRGTWKQLDFRLTWHRTSFVRRATFFRSQFNNNRRMNDALIRDCYNLWILASVALPFDKSLRQSGNLEPSAHEYVANPLQFVSDIHRISRNVARSGVRPANMTKLAAPIPTAAQARRPLPLTFESIASAEQRPRRRG
jgi:hypothetical protein